MIVSYAHKGVLGRAEYTQFLNDPERVEKYRSRSFEDCPLEDFYLKSSTLLVGMEGLPQVVFIEALRDYCLSGDLSVYIDTCYVTDDTQEREERNIPLLTGTRYPAPASEFDNVVFVTSRRELLKDLPRLMARSGIPLESKHRISCKVFTFGVNFIDLMGPVYRGSKSSLVDGHLYGIRPGDLYDLLFALEEGLPVPGLIPNFYDATGPRDVPVGPPHSLPYGHVGPVCRNPRKPLHDIDNVAPLPWYFPPSIECSHPQGLGSYLSAHLQAKDYPPDIYFRVMFSENNDLLEYQSRSGRGHLRVPLPHTDVKAASYLGCSPPRPDFFERVWSRGIRDLTIDLYFVKQRDLKLLSDTFLKAIREMGFRVTFTFTILDREPDESFTPIAATAVGLNESATPFSDIRRHVESFGHRTRVSRGIVPHFISQSLMDLGDRAAKWLVTSYISGAFSDYTELVESSVQSIWSGVSGRAEWPVRPSHCYSCGAKLSNQSLPKWFDQIQPPEITASRHQITFILDSPAPVSDVEKAVQRKLGFKARVRWTQTSYYVEGVHSVPVEYPPGITPPSIDGSQPPIRITLEDLPGIDGPTVGVYVLEVPHREVTAKTLSTKLRMSRGVIPAGRDGKFTRYVEMVTPPVVSEGKSGSLVAAILPVESCPRDAFQSLIPGNWTPTFHHIKCLGYYFLHKKPEHTPTLEPLTREAYQGNQESALSFLKGALSASSS